MAGYLGMGSFPRRPGPVLCLPWPRLGPHCCVYNCCLDRTWIRNLMSLWFWVCHLPAKIRMKFGASRASKDPEWCQLTFRWCVSFLICNVGESQAWLVSISRWPHVNTVSRAQPELSTDISACVNGPYGFFLKELFVDLFFSSQRIPTAASAVSRQV